MADHAWQLRDSRVRPFQQTAGSLLERIVILAVQCDGKKIEVVIYR
jgi:hypothetical protein